MKGKVSADGKAITGELIQAGHNLPFQLERKGETKLTADAKTPGPIGELKGEWEGALNAGGQTLRLKFKISPSLDGSLAGVLDSIDQQVFIPIDSATEEAGNVSLVLSLIGGTFKGKLGTDKKSIEGSWETEWKLASADPKTACTGRNAEVIALLRREALVPTPSTTSRAAFRRRQPASRPRIFCVQSILSSRQTPPAYQDV